MGYAPAKRPVKRVKFKSNPKYWADVYTKLRFKEQKAFGLIQGSGLQYITIAADTALEHLIAEWNLDDDEGNPIPITKESINELDQDDADALLTVLADIVWPNAAKDVEIREARKKKSTRT